MLRRQSRGSVPNSSQSATIVSPSTETELPTTGAQKLKQKKEKGRAEIKMSATKPQIKTKPKFNAETGKVEYPSKGGSQTKRKSPVSSKSSDFETVIAKPAEGANVKEETTTVSVEEQQVEVENISEEEGSDDSQSGGRKKSCPSLKGVKDLMKRNSKNGEGKKNGKPKSKTPSPKAMARKLVSNVKRNSSDEEIDSNLTENKTTSSETSFKSTSQTKKKVPPKVPPKPTKAAAKAKRQTAVVTSEKTSVEEVEATVELEEVPAPVMDDVERMVIVGDSPDSEAAEETAYFVKELSDESCEEDVCSFEGSETVEEIIVSDEDAEEVVVEEWESSQAEETDNVEVVVEADEEMEGILITGEVWESTDDIEEVEMADQQVMEVEDGAGQTSYQSVEKRGSKTQIKLSVPPSTVNTKKKITVSDVVQPAMSQTTVQKTTVVKTTKVTKTDTPVVRPRMTHTRKSRREEQSEETEDVTDFSAYTASNYQVVQWKSIDGKFEYESEVERVRDNIKPIIAARPSIQFILSEKAKRAASKEKGANVDRNAYSEESQEVADGLETLAGERQEDKKDMSLLNERLVEYVEKSRFLEVQNQILANEAEMMKAEYQEDRANLTARYEVELDQLQRLIGVTTTKCEEVTKKKTCAEENFESHENRLQEVEAKLVETQTTKSDLLVQLGEIESELATLRRRVGDFETSSKRYRNSIKHLRMEKSLLYSDIEKERIATEEAKEKAIELKTNVELVKAAEELEMKELVGADVRDSMKEDREQWHSEFTERFQEIYKDYLARTKALHVEGESVFRTAILEQQLENSTSTTETQHFLQETQKIRQQIEYFSAQTLELETRIAQRELKLKYMEEEKTRYSAEHEEKQHILQEDLASCQAELSSTRDKIKEVFDSKLDLEAEITRFAELLAGEETRIDEDIESTLKSKRLVKSFRMSRRPMKGVKKFFKSAIKSASKFAAESVSKSAAEIVSKSTTEFVSESSMEFASESAMEFVSKCTTEFVSESATEFVSESS